MIHTPSINPTFNARDRPSTSHSFCLFCETAFASPGSLLGHLNRVEIPRRLGHRFSCPACARLDEVDLKLWSIWEWLAHVRTAHEWPLSLFEPCLVCAHLCMPGAGLRRHFTRKHSDKLKKPFECAACEAGALPKREKQLINSFEAFLHHAIAIHPSKQAPGHGAVTGKRKRDEDREGDYEDRTALAGYDSNEGDDRHDDTAVVRDECSESEVVWAGSVEGKNCRRKAEPMRPSAELDPDFLRRVDPCLRAA